MASLQSRRRRDTRKSVVEHITKVLELHEKLDESHLVKIHEIFENEDEKRLNQTEFRDVLHKVAKITYSDDEYSILFMKINTTRNGLVTWNELISYLILLFQQSEITTGFTSLDLPIARPPVFMRTNHRYPVNRIRYFATMYPDRRTTWHDGSVITCSHDGTINYWSLDMQLERTCQSTCPELKVQSTWLTDLVTMPDVNVICTSSTERDLRFYDTSARKFELRVMFTSIDDAICAMNYAFDIDVNVNSKLILGDMAGNIQIVYIESKERGPFKSKPGLPLLQVNYSRVLKGLVDGFRVLSLNRTRSASVRQISYYGILNSVVYCSDNPKAGLVMMDLNETKGNYVYRLPKGAWCFALVKSAHLIASGSSDCLVRLWNPFVPELPIATLYGHHTGIISMVFQDKGKLLYSFSKDRCIKVWDVVKQTCIQTYIDISEELGKKDEISTMYNPESRQWIIASSMMTVLELSPKQKSDHTDGFTHIGGISVILYNTLFKLLVTCGLDSYVIVWNPFDGRRMLTVPHAHTQTIHAELISVEITAACFDPGWQRLLTGAHDGTLKIWNFNTGTCLRNLKIAENHEIKSVIWIKNRIMAMGWNKRVVEFADNDGEDVAGKKVDSEFSKNWDLRHVEEISAGAVRVPQTLVTGSYNGELILWRLETGQPYRQFNVSDPTRRIKIKINFRPTKGKKKEPEKLGRVSYVDKRRQSLLPPAPAQKNARSRRVSTVVLPEHCIPLQKLAIHCMMFLTSRTMDPANGTLLIALENGSVQVWSHHIAGGFITSFTAIHKAGDYIVSMTSDINNEFLFTGTSGGYIKTWLLKNYCILEENDNDDASEKISMPKYRLMFPFMWNDFFLGRAARIVRTQPKPVLLNSYRGHLMPVSGLTYINELKVIISSSTDFTARLWTLGGRYLQTLGTFKDWKPLKSDGSGQKGFEYTIPPDVRKIASSTTFRVLNGGATTRKLSLKQQQMRTEKEMTDIDYRKIYGQKLVEPILGHNYSVRKTRKTPGVVFDTSYPYIPIYQHCIMPPPKNK